MTGDSLELVPFCVQEHNLAAEKVVDFRQVARHFRLIIHWANRLGNGKHGESLVGSRLEVLHP